MYFVPPLGARQGGKLVMVLGRLPSALAATALVALAGCAVQTEGPAGPGGPAVAPMSLSDTTWQLVEFESMDDAEGTRRPAPDRTVTATFEADGSLALKLDCNRGASTWEQGAHHATGSGLTIGPVASTRALCPEPTIGAFVARSLPDVASYMLRDGKLFLALKMDGGIFEFAPVEP
jgi:heat shock protein HslJ